MMQLAQPHRRESSLLLPRGRNHRCPCSAREQRHDSSGIGANNGALALAATNERGSCSSGVVPPCALPLEDDLLTVLALGPPEIDRGSGALVKKERKGKRRCRVGSLLVGRDWFHRVLLL
ncbi:hypothetical protein PIB30_073216 [Stylosanthes scabra]|uniref:Uncharacterized protein n=1 Tax=Stylosanthes scabra TaxID=79078 RepID=A0ABU6VNT5_9FABA|nr:hypothetical protein [Stylosanthes scabra]